MFNLLYLTSVITAITFLLAVCLLLANYMSTCLAYITASVHWCCWWDDLKAICKRYP